MESFVDKILTFYQKMLHTPWIGGKPRLKYCKALSSNNFSFSPISQLNVRLLIQLIHKLLPLKSDIVANEEDRNILLAQLCKDRLLRKQGDDFYHGVHRFPIYVTTHLTQKMWNE